ncbi:hypothetical protein COBT_000119 [Conglomerata obtusa]
MKLYRSQNNTNLEDLYVKNPNLHPLYVNVNKCNEKTTLRFSKEKTDFLYVLSENDYKNPFDLLERSKCTDQPQVNLPVEKKRTNVDKKTKQANLFTFMKK